MHVTGLIQSDQAGNFTWSEAPNASGGTSITAYNNNRQSTNTATLTVASDPTYVSSGTILFQGPIGESGNPNVAIGGNFSARQEWILAASTLYLLRYTSETADSRVLLALEWYEES